MPASPSILVVDDEPYLLQFVEQVLQKAGYQVATAADGRKAAGMLAEKRFDVVLTDLLMPERNGIELIDELRREYPAVRIVAMSGGGRVGSGQYLQIAKGFGVRSLLEKPFNNQQLLSAIDRALAA